MARKSKEILVRGFSAFNRKTREALGYRSKLSKADQKEIQDTPITILAEKVIIEPLKGDPKSYEKYRESFKR
jgi:hypothetical protein